jgi:hypothetical protein
MTSPPERRAAQSCRGSGGFSLFFVLASAEHRVRFFSINICSRSSFNRATLPFNMNPLETVKRHEQKSEVRPKLFERRTCTCFSLVHGSRRRMKRHRCDMQNDGAVDSPTLTLRWGEFESQVQLLYGQTDPNARGLSLLLSNMTANSRIDREVTQFSPDILRLVRLSSQPVCSSTVFDDSIVESKTGARGTEEPGFPSPETFPSPNNAFVFPERGRSRARRIAFASRAPPKPIVQLQKRAGHGAERGRGATPGVCESGNLPQVRGAAGQG